MAAVMEYTSAPMSFPLSVANEVLQFPGCDPFAAAGGSSEGLPSLEVSDYITFDEGSRLLEDSPPFPVPAQFYQNPLLPAEGTGDSSTAGQTSSSSLKCEGRVQKARMEAEVKIAFRTMSEIDVLIDGYKWRKYGKKFLKNSPYPRNYFRCSAEGCNVKKRVERDREDHRYVITTYEGKHCHPPPGAVYYPIPRDHPTAAAAGAKWGSSSRPGAAGDVGCCAMESHSSP